MVNTFEEYTRQHDLLVCVDSDGCAMDTMDCKHKQCFGPCMVREWGLQKWQDEILRRWDEINLYQLTRGINRFKGLNMALTEINEKYLPITGLEALTAWVENAPALSNGALEVAASRAIDAPGRLCLEKALAWSLAVNAAIDAMPAEEKKPFPGAREGLAAAAQIADVAIVSSANRGAVMEEWERCALLDHVDIVLAQDVGSKAACIARLLEFGYRPDQVLMVGDAPGDRDAAAKNGVWFYPILVRHEEESWAALPREALPHLRDGSYAPYQQQKLDEFIRNLGG